MPVLDRADPRVHDLAPFLDVVADRPADVGQRLIFCDYLDETLHPIADQARTLASGEPGPFLALFAYARFEGFGQESIITCPLTPFRWPVAVFSAGAAPQRILIETETSVRLRLAFVPGPILIEWFVAGGIMPSAWRPPTPERIINNGWIALWACDPFADRLRLRITTEH